MLRGWQELTTSPAGGNSKLTLSGAYRDSATSKLRCRVGVFVNERSGSLGQYAFLSKSIVTTVRAIILRSSQIDQLFTYQMS